MLARLCAFVVWGLVAATAVFWGLRLLVHAPAAPAYAVAVGDAAAVRGDLTRLLGAAPVAAAQVTQAAPASSRFRLLGIVAPKYADAAAKGSHGVALIAVDGKMPKAYVVGAQLDGDLILQSVSLRTVSIGAAPGKTAITLELPPLTAAATGTLPVPGASTGAAAVPPAMPVPQYPPQPVMPQVANPAAGGQVVPPPMPIPRSETGVPLAQ